LTVNPHPENEKMKKRTLIVVACSLLALLFMFAPSSVQADYTEVAVPEGFRPWTLAIDASNNIWLGANKWEGTPQVWNGYILMYNTTSQTFSNFSIPTSNPGPILSITIDSANNKWVTEREAHKIAKVNGDVTEYAVGSVEDPTYPVAVEANGTDIWIGCAKFADNKIMKFIPSTQSLINYTLPAEHSDSEIRDMEILGGIVWFTDARSNYIGELDPDTSTFTFHGPLYNHPLYLDIDSQNNVWFTENWGNRLGVYNSTTSAITEYALNTTLGSDTPYGLVVDNNDDIWFSENYLKKIGKFDHITKVITEYDVNCKPYDVVKDNIGNLWFIGAGSWKIGRLDPMNYVGKRKENGLQATVSAKSTATAGEEFSIRVMIKNTSPGTVADITVSLTTRRTLTITSGQPEVNIGTLKPDQWTIVEWHVIATRKGKLMNRLSANGLLADGSSVSTKVAWRIVSVK
jgi:streptogramin lyase